MTSDGAKTILLVEDERVTALMTSTAIQKAGYHVITAYSGESAIQIAQSNNEIDIILMDIELGDGIDGTEAAQIILSKRNIPIVFLSSHTEKEYVDKVKKIARYGYVVKNSGDFVLLSSIEMAFELNNANIQVKESEERYKRITDGLTDYLYTVKVKDGKAVETNHCEACYAVTGYTAKEFSENPYLWFNMIVPEEREWVAGSFSRIINGEKLNPIEHRIICRDGKIKWISDTSISKYDSSGKLVSYDGVIKDITERKHTEDLLVSRAKALSTTQEATISSMAILAEFRDPETGGHIQRTKLYVKLILEKISENLPYASGDIELIWHSAPLHDIGKVAIPDSILLKPGRLTSDEFDIMKKHTTFGCDAIQRTETILGENSFLNFAKEISKYHHEKWDGTGYPFALKGEDIPLSARIMALADVYDALVSERPYKKSLSHDRAIEIILKGSGSHFEPHLVKIFIDNNEDFNFIAKQYAD